MALKMIELSKDAGMGKSVRQLIRYGLVGLFTNFVSYLIYLLITYIGVEPKMVMTLLYIAGALIGFVGHRTWTFAQNGALLGTGARYFITHFFGYLINFLILFTFVDKLGYPHQLVQAVAIIFVAGFLFIVFKYYVFRERI
jgi:putative flippase GtrA